MKTVKRYVAVHLLCIILFFISSLAVTPILNAEDGELEQYWNDEWEHYQKISLPIDTDSKQAKFQPIDMRLTFDYPCWGINESVHSIRVCSWNGTNWDELEVQIYNLDQSDDQTISSCNIVFLVPSYATGDEEYVVFYDDEEKSSPSYVDHVQLLDKYYYFEPISGISVEGDYYEIREDGVIVYGVGQKGRVLNRYLSQIAIRMKPGTKEFDMLKTDLLASFCFSYQDGPAEDDEVASDQVLIGKEVLVDGNLMVQFRISSKSENDVLFTSNVYTYYYQPGEDKRISVRVHHEIKEEAEVTGIKNVDGRFGTIISYHSKSPSVKKMVFGDILPFLHVSSDESIREYALEKDPKSSKREWVISYTDDCDLGPDAWIAYGNGETGKTHGLIFFWNQGIVQNATDERDGIEVKLAEKEYLDVIGAEVDYASITFGRNAFEPYQTHDLIIDKGSQYTFDVEFYTTYDGGYKRIEEESVFFQRLVSFRDINMSSQVSRDIYTLTVIPQLTGRLFSYPLLRNFTGLSFPVIIAELYQNETLVAEEMVDKPVFGIQSLKFPKLSPGKYQVKLFRLLPDNKKSYIGFGSIDLTGDNNLHVYCTWEQDVEVSIFDQFGNGVSEVRAEIWQGPHLVASGVSNSYPVLSVSAPFPLFKPYVIDDLKNATVQDLFQWSQPYVLKAYYKGFKVFDATLSSFSPSEEIQLSIHDVVIEIRDGLGYPPDVNVIPEITSEDMVDSASLKPSFTLERGRFQFRNIPKGSYVVRIAFAGYENEKKFSVPESGGVIPIQFLARKELTVEVLTSRGEYIESSDLLVRVMRNGNEIGTEPVNKPLVLPPGTYGLSLFDNGKLIGSDVVELTSDKSIPVVTTIPSVLYLVVTFTAIILLAEVMLIFYFKKISLNTALKLVILGVVLVGVMQPWWTFYGESDDESVVKISHMYLYPSTMIEEYRVDDSQYLSLSTIPEMFTSFVETLLLIIAGGLVLLLISFIPNMLLKKRFEFALVASGIIFMLLVSIAFFVGMNQIAQLSLGSLQGSGMIPVNPPYNGEVMVSASWGLGPGFFIVFFAACLAVFAGILDYMRKHRLLAFLHRNHSK